MTTSKLTTQAIDMADLLEMIASAKVYDVAIVSALSRAERLSTRLDNNILLKREDQQSVFSFKLRGAYNKIVNLSEQQRQAGVIAASAGNHAQGVALAAKRLNIQAQIVMPQTTPSIKVEGVRAHGADVILYGDAYDNAYVHACELAQATKKTFIHPYDDLEVIAGQGTIGKEILEQLQDTVVDAVFVPVGGGGLIAGVAAWIKKYAPSIKIIGVEPEDASTLYSAMQAKERVVLPQVGIFADGVAVKQIGELTYQIAKDLVDEVILVKVDELCGAIKDIFDDTRVVSEPAGALAVAGIKKYIERENCHHKTFIGINSGANINFDRLRHVTERSELGENREALLAVTIQEQKGSFLKFCSIIGAHSVSEFNYRYADNHQAQVFVGVKFDNAARDKQILIGRLAAENYAVSDITDNEMAKLHLRHMVGGHSPDLRDEVLYRFEFPERPGALLQFLEMMGERWNISLFHYRNHGAAYGRVLVGAQVVENERTDFESFLDDLGYNYFNETENTAYKLFLQ